MNFHGDEALSPKQVARLEHIYSMLSDREKQGQITPQITYTDFLTISLLMNNLYGTSRSFDDKKAKSPLFSLIEINKVLKDMSESLDNIAQDFKKTLYNSRQAKTLGLDPEPLYMAVHILSKMLFFVNEAVWHMAGVMPHADRYRFWDILKLSLDKAHWEQVLRNQRKRD